MKIEVIFPVYNESDTLSNQIKKFNDYFDINYRKNLIITIADNGSKDLTPKICESLLKNKIVNNSF